MNSIKRVLILLIVVLGIIVPINVFAAEDVYDVILFWGQSNMVGYAGNTKYNKCTDKDGNEITITSSYPKDKNLLELKATAYASATGIDSAIVSNYTKLDHVDVPITEGTVYDYSYLESALKTVTKNTVNIGENIYVTINNAGKPTFASSGTLSLQRSYGTNLTAWYGYQHYKNTGHKVVIVLAARGSQEINRFLPHDSKGNNDSTEYTNDSQYIYEAMVTKYKAAINYLESNGYKIGHKFHVVFQGGADAGNLTETDKWYKSYKNIHARLKDELGMEFGTIIETSYTIGSTAPYQNGVSGVSLVNNAQEQVISNNVDIILGSDYSFNRYIPPKSYYSSNYLGNSNVFLQSGYDYDTAKERAKYSTSYQCYYINEETGKQVHNTIHFNSAALSQIGLETANNVYNYLKKTQTTKSIQVGDFVYFDPVKNSSCSQSNYWTPYNTNTTCYRWAVININNDGTLRLLLDHNSHENIKYSETLEKLGELKTINNWDDSLELKRLGTSKALELMQLDTTKTINAFVSDRSLDTVKSKLSVGFIYSDNYAYDPVANKTTRNSGYWVVPTNVTATEALGDNEAFYVNYYFYRGSANKANVGLRPTVDSIPVSKVSRTSSLGIHTGYNRTESVFNGGDTRFKNALITSQDEAHKITKYAAQGMVVHQKPMVDDLKNLNEAQYCDTYPNSCKTEFCIYLTQRMRANDPYPNDHNETGMMFCTTDPIEATQVNYQQVTYYHGNDFTYNYKDGLYAGTIFGNAVDGHKFGYGLSEPKYIEGSDIFDLVDNGVSTGISTSIEDQELSYDYDHNYYYVGNKNYKAPINDNGNYTFMMSTSEEQTLTAQGHEYHEGYIYDVQYEAGNNSASGCSHNYCLASAEQCNKYQVYCDNDEASRGKIYIYNAKLNKNGEPSRSYGKLARVLYIDFNDLTSSSCKFNEFEAVSFADKHSSMMYMSSHAQYESGNAYPKIYGINLDNVRFSDGRYLYRDYVYYSDQENNTERYHSGDIVDLNYYGNNDDPAYLGWIYSRKGNGTTTNGDSINVSEKFIKNDATVITPASTDTDNIKIYLKTVKLESSAYRTVTDSRESLEVNEKSIQAFLSKLTCTRCTAVVMKGNTELTSGNFEDGENYKLVIKATSTNGVVDNGSKILEKTLLPQNYAVSYDANGGTGAPETQSYTYAESGNIELSNETPSRVGYTFKSWNTEADGSGTTYMPGASFSKSVNSNTVLYAQWEAHKVFIKINVNGGSLSEQHGDTIGISGNNITVDDSVNIHTIKYNGSLGQNGLVNYNNSEYINIIREGYEAPIDQEWKTESGNFYSQKTVYNASDFCDITADNCTVELLVNWVPVNYTISYTLNNGTVSNNPTSYNIESENITLNNPTKTGYTFTGWTGSNGDNPETVVSINKGTTGNKQYVANYSPNKYKIVFNSNGGTGTMDDLNMEYGVSKSIPNNTYVNEGYKFAGWNTSPLGAGNNYSEGESITNLTEENNQEITLYAMWVQDKFTIRYVTNGGTNNPNNPTAYNQGSTKELLPATKTGSTFEGWYKDSELTEKVEGITADMAEDLILYAKWTVNTYTITFNSNGGSTVESITKQYNEEVNKPTNPTKEGYAFEGWYSDEQLSRVYNFGVMPAENITLYAKWREVIYDVLFDTVGGTELDPIKIKENSKITRPSNPEKIGYRFVDWYLDRDYSVTYNFDSPVVSDLTLYAKWETASFTVTFNTLGGSSIEPINVMYNELIPLPNNPTKKGYTFNNWVDENQNVFTSGRMPAKDITLYATWNKNSYTITFNSNGGSSVASITAYYGDEIEAPADPSKNKYKFAGWYTDSDLTNLYSFTTMPDKNMTLYAKWIAKGNVISYELAGGTNNESNPTSYIDGDKKTLYNPIKRGYTFKGWYLDPEYNNVVTKTDNLEGDITLYAKWEVNKYTIAFNSNGGTSVASVVLEYSAPIESLPEPERSRFEFIGWYIDESLRTLFDYDYMPDTDFNLYARWEEEKKVQITFNTNGGSNVNQISEYVGVEIEQPSDPVKEGYRFTGWYSDQELTKLYSFTTMPEEDLVLYAKWVDNNNKIITYDLDGGTNNISNPTSYQDGEDIQLEEPTREGYTFVGWYSDPEYINKVEKITVDMAEDLTLYAKWKSNVIVDVPNTFKAATVIKIIGLIILAIGSIVMIRQNRKEVKKY